MISNQRPVERRGRRPSLRAFLDADDVRAVLAEAISQQRVAARAKLTDVAHWQGVGEIELAAAAAAESAVGACAIADGDAVKFAKACHDTLNALAQAFRDDESDADGYGLGTVYAIQRVLEDRA